MNKISIDKIIDEIFSYTSILNDKLLFKSDPLDEKLEELASIVNKKRPIDKTFGNINLFDLKHIYISELDKIGMKHIKGETKKLEYGNGNVLSQSAKDTIRQILNELSPNKYTVTLTVKNYIGSFDLSDISLDGVIFEFDKKNKEFSITLNTNGYFDLNENNKSLNFSSTQSAIAILKMIFTYLSFFKNSIWVGETFNYEQELLITIKNDSNDETRTIETYDDDIILILYPCHIKYEYRKYDSKNINIKFIDLITKHKYLLLAFEWFSRSIRSSNNENRIIMLCIAFEALYGKHNSTKEQTKNKDTYMLKTVYFISESEKEREQYSTILMDLFKQRNGIVHADIKLKSEIQLSRLFHQSKDAFIKTFFKELTIHKND